MILSCHRSSVARRPVGFFADSSTPPRVRRDPTGTTPLRARFERDLMRRFGIVKRMAREALTTQDILGLRPSQSAASSLRSFSFAASPSASDRASAFMDWLYRIQREHVLGLPAGASQAEARRSTWLRPYILQGYAKGRLDALAKFNSRLPTKDARRTLLSRFGKAPDNRVEFLLNRSFRDLEGITDAMDLVLNRLLAQGIQEGWAIEKLAREISDAIDEIGIVRARVLARTEIIRAHAEGALDSYAELEVQGVGVEAEFTTAGDDSVCAQCNGYSGQVFSLAQARGMIPLHPNCRCAWTPVL